MTKTITTGPTMSSLLVHALRGHRAIRRMSGAVDDVTGRKTVFNVVGVVALASAATASMAGHVGAEVQEAAQRELLERATLMGFLDEIIEALPPELDLETAQSILSARLGDYKARYGARAREAIDDVVRSMHWEARRRGALDGAFTFEDYLDHVSISNGASFFLRGCVQIVHASDEVPQYKDLFTAIDRALRLKTDMAKVWKDIESRENVLLQYMDLSPTAISLDEAVQAMNRRYQILADQIVGCLASCRSDPACSPAVLACAESFWKNGALLMDRAGKVYHLFRVRDAVSGAWSGGRARLKRRLDKFMGG